MPELQRLVLSNGLVLLGAHRPGLHHAALRLTLPAGSRHDPARQGGLAHFFEHMSFRGTARHPSEGALALALEELGIDANAFTDPHDLTFEMTGPSCAAPDMARHLAEMLLTPRFEGIGLERDVVRQEIRGETDPLGGSREPWALALRALYGAHPVSRPVLGTDASVRGLRESHLRAHRARHLAAASAVAVLVSPEPPGPALAAAAEALGALPARAEAPSPPPGEPTLLAPAPLVQKTGRPGATIELAFPTGGGADPDGAALEVIEYLLSDGMASRLWRALRGESGLAYEASAGWHDRPERGIFSVSAGVEHEAAPEAARRALEALTVLAAQGPEEAELARARRRARFHLDNALDHAAGLADYYESGERLGRRMPYAARAARFEAVSAEAVRAVATRTFAPSRLYPVAVAALSPRGRRAFLDLPQAHAARWAAAGLSDRP